MGPIRFNNGIGDVGSRIINIIYSKKVFKIVSRFNNGIIILLDEFDNETVINEKEASTFFMLAKKIKSEPSKWK